ncbi:MAG: 3-phosphoshikimate 1-carboxyvinyltransferase, partial [Clostridia bacterium]|nr:3-phosphoshikimate 1-carboxyvinyltransferase [Clostridia bacterium]
IRGGMPIPGGTADAYGDHRIAMAAAIAAVRAEGESIIRGAEAVNKSYPGFWRDLESLGGQVILSEGE